MIEQDLLGVDYALGPALIPANKTILLSVGGEKINLKLGPPTSTTPFPNPTRQRTK